jgi:dihydrodipicolinate synthase/N-acetylneuraminate lyase
MSFPTVMALPQSAVATPAGVETALRHFSERLGRPITLYLKRDDYLSVDGVGRLVDDGLVCAIKYAVVRKDPAQDDYLRLLLDRVERHFLVSGIGERPAVVHLRDFGLSSFTSGSGAIAPRASTALLQALKEGDYERAEAIRSVFLPLEDLRDAIHPIRVLHEAVTLSGVANMGPILPHLHNLEREFWPKVREAAEALLAYDEKLQRESMLA